MGGEGKVVIFNEREIRGFMAKVWHEMTTNFGVIGDLRNQLERSPTGRGGKSRKNSAQKSVSIKSSKSKSKLKSKKKKMLSEKKKKAKSKGKSRKRKPGGDSTKGARGGLKKRKSNALKMNTVKRRSSTTDYIQKPSFSTKRQKKDRTKKGSFTPGRLDELISRDRAKTDEMGSPIKPLRKKKGRSRSQERLLRSKSRLAIRGFRDGLSFSNFAEKTKELFKNRLVEHGRVLSDYQGALVTLKSKDWQTRLSRVFKELRGENIY